MTRKDSAFVLALVAVLGVVAALVAGPALAPAASTAPTLAPIAGPTDRPYREGVLGHPQSVSPLTARTQADRDLVALLFPGLVRLGPDGSVVPDLAARWTASDDGRSYTFELRDDARWHDGTPVTADDVAFTIHALQDPGYTGPRASSWTGVTVEVTGTREVRFTLETPLGGFLQAATQPIAPAHLLADVPVSLLPDHPFGAQPVGSGTFELDTLEPDLAVLRPVTLLPGENDPTPPPAGPTDSLATMRPTPRPELPRPYLDGIEFHYYDDPEALAADFRAGRLDGASGIDPTVAADLAAERGSQLLRYPGSTLTAVLVNLRPGNPAFATPEVRTALLAAIDRDAIVAGAFEGAATVADLPIPPSSPWFDPTVKAAVEFDPEAAATALTKAGWKRADGQWRSGDAKEPLSVELLSPDAESNPAAYAAAEAVASDWAAFGLEVDHVGLPAGEFVSDRLASGKFSAAVVDVAIGLDPDLYPLLASTQTLSGGSNVAGIQDAALDALLVAARAPGSDEDRAAAYTALQEQLAKGRYLLPLAFADETAVVHTTVSGPAVRQVSDPSDRFWDVLTWRLADDR
jgi:peptide/nickel transport system substrate-binding protein